MNDSITGPFIKPSVSHSFTMRLSYPNVIGSFSRIVQAVGRRGGDLGAIDLVSSDSKTMTRDVTVRARDDEHVKEIVAAIRRLKRVKIVNV